MIAWMLYSVIVALCAVIAASAAEWLLRAGRRPIRFVWIGAATLSLGLSVTAPIRTRMTARGAAHEIDPASLAPIQRIRRQAIGSLQTMLAAAFAPEGSSAFVQTLAAELSRFTICFCDGAFVSHQVDPRETDLRRLFDDLRIGLLAIAKSRLRRKRRRA